MKQLFGQNVLDKTKDEYLQELAELASDPACLVLIDTNIVAYMYKLHAAARREFFIWVDGLVAKERLAIPSWCAGEYLARVRDGQLGTYLPKSGDPDQPRKALEAMLDTATLFVDETILASIEFRGDRSAFLAQFKDAIDALQPFSRAFKHQFDSGAVHEEILTHLGPTVLDSDVASFCERADREGPARVAHRLPPAFRDDDKPENKLGDLIIWYEILAFSQQKSGTFKKVLFVTNDQKSDWVYAPPKRATVVRGARKVLPNIKPRIKIIDPRLVAEFHRLVGHEHVTICGLPSLVEGISKVNPTQVGQLAAAIQINLATQAPDEPRSDSNNSLDTPLAMSDAGEDTGSPSSGDVAAETTASTVILTVSPAADDGGHQSAQEPREIAVDPQLTFDEDGYRDASYEADAPGEINEVIRALKSHNWYVQNPAIDKLKELRDGEFPATSWFVLGRNIYQAACGNAQKAMNFLVNLDIQLNRFSTEAADATLAGMAFEIYFDGQGQLRAAGKSGYLDKVLSVLSSDRYPHVRQFIQERLVAANAKLRYLPGEKHDLTLLFRSSEISKAGEALEVDEITTDGDKVRLLDSVKLEGVELIADQSILQEGPWGGFTRSYTVAEIVSEVSTALLIPRWALKRMFDPAVRPDVHFRLPEEKWLWVKSAAPE
jgi:hypothetical protein